MRKILFFLLATFLVNPIYARDPNEQEIIVNQTIGGGRYEGSIPEVKFNSSGVLTINFDITTFECYTLTITSIYTDVDFVITSSSVSIPLLVDGFSDYSIIIETNDGNVFEGTLNASEYASGQMY